MCLLQAKDSLDELAFEREREREREREKDRQREREREREILITYFCCC